MNNGSIVIKDVFFTVASGKLLVYLPDRKLPVKFMDKNESLDMKATSMLEECLGISVKKFYFEQLYTFSVGNEIAIVYYFLVPEFAISTNQKGEWKDIYSLKTVNKNDRSIIEYAVSRLKSKVEYTNIVYSLLSEEFTFSELQAIYEAILGRKLDKRNFRKKILSLNLLRPTGKKKLLGKARPAEMFSFRKRELTFVEVL